MLDRIKYAFNAAVGRAPADWEEERYRFFRAVRNDDVQTVQAIAAKQPLCTGWTSEDGPPLAVAINSGSLRAFAALRLLGADVNAECPQKNGKTRPLHLAVKKGRADFVRDLVAAGAHLDARSEERSKDMIVCYYNTYTPLAIAIRNKDKAMVKALAECGADLTAACHSICLDGTKAFSYSPVDYARDLKQFALADLITTLQAEKYAPVPSPAPVTTTQAPAPVNAPLRLRLVPKAGNQR